MTIEERSRLTKSTFRELWDDLWVDKTAYMFSEGYPKAKRKFEMVSDDIPRYNHLVDAKLSEPFWAFPKGRREDGEMPLETAKREFEEETRLSTSNLQILTRETMSENFSGLNGKQFSTLYFLAKMPKPILPSRILLENSLRSSTISSEAYDLKWMTFEHAISRIEDFRKSILKDAYARVRRICALEE